MAEPLYRANVLVCGGTGCEASGSSSTYQMLVEEVERRGLAAEVEAIHTGCRGFCAMGPVMIIYPDGIFYCQVKAEDVPLLVEETLVKGRVVERLTYKEPSAHQAVPFYGEIPFYSKQLRITLRNCGMIDPENIDEYIARDGYQALAKALSSMTPAAGDRRGQALGAARPRRRRLPHRPEVGVHRQGAGRRQVRGLQRRRRRPRRFHGPLASSRAIRTA